MENHTHQSAALRNSAQRAAFGLVGRESLAELIVLAAVAHEHLLVIGPPGTGKSAVVRRVAESLGGRYFEYLLGRFTEPSEIFGPIDLRKLREGTVETETADMLPEAEIAFLDEVFLGSTAILNTLLSLLNERTFRRGHTRLQCPLRVCVGASNTLPSDESLAAFADRFLVHVFVDPVPDHQLEALLAGGRSITSDPLPACSAVADIDALASVARAMDTRPFASAFARAVRLLRKSGIDLSDRRIVKAQALCAAAAALAGRDEPGSADLWPLIYVIPTREGQELGRDVLRPVLENTDNAALAAAAEDASMSPAARARRLANEGLSLLANEPSDADTRASWVLRLESLGRLIDAGFPTKDMPSELTRVRERLAGFVGATERTEPRAAENDDR
jgi:MoxR-like ATPase